MEAGGFISLKRSKLKRQHVKNMALLTCILNLYSLDENISPCVYRKETTLKVGVFSSLKKHSINNIL